MKQEYVERVKKAESLFIGGPVADTEAHLCLYAHNIDLQTISSRLGVEPTEGVRRGDVIGRRRPAMIGLWCLQAPKDLPFEDKLRYLLRATTRQKTTWVSLAANHSIQLRCAVYLHSWNEGFDLPSELLAEIGRRHWQFGLDLYGAEGDEVLEALLSNRPKKQTQNKN